MKAISNIYYSIVLYFKKNFDFLVFFEACEVDDKNFSIYELMKARDKKLLERVLTFFLMWNYNRKTFTHCH